MDTIVVIAIIAFIIFLIFGIFIPAIIYLWPLWLCLAVFLTIYRAFQKRRFEKEMKDAYEEEQTGGTNENGDPNIIDVDYKVVDEEKTEKD